MIFGFFNFHLWRKICFFFSFGNLRLSNFDVESLSLQIKCGLFWKFDLMTLIIMRNTLKMDLIINNIKQSHKKSHKCYWASFNLRLFGKVQNHAHYKYDMFVLAVKITKLIIGKLYLAFLIEVNTFFLSIFKNTLLTMI